MGRVVRIAAWCAGPVLAAGLLTGCLPEQPRASPPAAGSKASPAPPLRSGTGLPTRAPARPRPETTAGSPRAGTALALLGRLPVKGRAPRTGYARDHFGPAWADIDRNGCDTRNDVLRRDLSGTTFRSGTHGCVVLSGVLAEPYTGRTLTFRKADAGAVQIDHVVSLSNAWQTGAFAWPAGKRLAFANDPANLLAVDGRANTSKSDSDAASWLPPDKGYRCQMVARQTAVKATYGLWVTRAEHDAIARVLSSCPTMTAPTGGNPASAAVAGAAAPADRPKAPSRTAPSGGRTDPQFGSCKEAARNGYGPYRQGRDPEYDSYRDADSDGIVCE